MLTHASLPFLPSNARHPGVTLHAVGTTYAGTSIWVLASFTRRSLTSSALSVWREYDESAQRSLVGVAHALGSGL